MEPGSGDDHTTMWRWVQRYGPALEQGLRRYLKPTNKSWRVDETYVRVALAPLQFSGIVRTELLTPEPNRFIRDDDSAFGEKVLDISEAQAESMVNPDGIADDFWRETMTVIARPIIHGISVSGRYPS
jgi:hypothetical protein